MNTCLICIILNIQNGLIIFSSSNIVNNDTDMQYKDTLDYFFLSNDCAGNIKVPQQTITKEFCGDINLTKFILVIPVKHIVVHHPSDHFPIVAVFSSKKY